MRFTIPIDYILGLKYSFRYIDNFYLITISYIHLNLFTKSIARGSRKTGNYLEKHDALNVYFYWCF